MHLERSIRKPETLDAAQEEFTKWCKEHGYEIVSHIHSFWQRNLFYKEFDAIVEATVRKAL